MASSWGEAVKQVAVDFVEGEFGAGEGVGGGEEIVETPSGLVLAVVGGKGDDVESGAAEEEGGAGHVEGGGDEDDALEAGALDGEGFGGGGIGGSSEANGFVWDAVIDGSEAEPISFIQGALIEFWIAGGGEEECGGFVETVEAYAGFEAIDGVVELGGHAGDLGGAADDAAQDEDGFGGGAEFGVEAGVLVFELAGEGLSDEGEAGEGEEEDCEVGGGAAFEAEGEGEEEQGESDGEEEGGEDFAELEEEFGHGLRVPDSVYQGSWQEFG